MNKRVIFLMQGEYQPKIMSLSKKDFDRLQKLLKQKMKERDGFSSGEAEDNDEAEFGCYPDEANDILERAKPVKHRVVDTSSDSWGIYTSAELEG